MENKQLQVFKNLEFGDLKVITRNDEPWFVAKDISQILEYSKAANMIERLDEDEKIKLNYSDSVLIGLENVNSQGMYIINESGLYSAILGSKKKESKKFKKWVTSEVLPSIRKHGAYMTEDTIEKALTSPDFLIQLATKLKEEQEARKLAEDKNKILIGENDALSKDIVKWADESVINALVRKYGAYIGDFASSWTEWKKNILYKYSININSRITAYLNETGKRTKPKTLSMLRDKEELTKGLKIIISMCKDKNIDISDVLGKHLDDSQINKIINN